MYLWPLGTIPTLLYTWQYYEMVEGAANPNGKRQTFWLRAGFVAVTTIGTLVATGMQGYYYALSFWYIEPIDGHFDHELSDYYCYLKNYMYDLMCCFSGLCCVGSVVMLGGTIFWVRKMTLSKDTSGLQADALNLRMVFGHIALLLS
jgi:hypothetical protein